jgi:hypothetical protein
VREGDKISYKRGGGVCLFICDEDLSQSEKEERNCDRKLAEIVIVTNSRRPLIPS